MWSENWIDVLSGVLLRINRAVKSSNRSVFFAFAYNYPSPYLLQFVMRLLPFGSADSHRLLPRHCPLPAALSLPSWLLPWKAPTFVFSLPDSFALGSRSPCQGLARKSLLFCELEGWEWQSGAAGFSISLCEAVLLSFRELPLWRWSWKLSFYALFWQPSHKYPVSSLIVWRFVYVSVTEIEQTVFVFRFSAPSNYWMMTKFWFGACTGISSIPASFEGLCQEVKSIVCLRSCSTCLLLAL